MWKEPTAWGAPTSPKGAGKAALLQQAQASLTCVESVFGQLCIYIMSAAAKSLDICSLIVHEPGSAEAFDPRAGC